LVARWLEETVYAFADFNEEVAIVDERCEFVLLQTHVLILLHESFQVEVFDVDHLNSASGVGIMLLKRYHRLTQLIPARLHSHSL
jgi:hypothetical protein